MIYIFVLLGCCWVCLAGLPLAHTHTGRERLKVFNSHSENSKAGSQSFQPYLLKTDKGFVKTSSVAAGGKSEVN